MTISIPQASYQYNAVAAAAVQAGSYLPITPMSAYYYQAAPSTSDISSPDVAWDASNPANYFHMMVPSPMYYQAQPMFIAPRDPNEAGTGAEGAASSVTMTTIASGRTMSTDAEL